MKLPTQEQRAAWLAEAKADYEASEAVNQMSFDEMVKGISIAFAGQREYFAIYMALKHNVPKGWIDALATAAGLPEWQEGDEDIVKALLA